MGLNNPQVVASEYQSLGRLAHRRLDGTAWVRGEMEWAVALEMVAQARPGTVLDAGSGTADFAAAITAPQVV